MQCHSENTVSELKIVDKTRMSQIAYSYSNRDMQATSSLVKKKLHRIM